MVPSSVLISKQLYCYSNIICRRKIEYTFIHVEASVTGQKYKRENWTLTANLGTVTHRTAKSWRETRLPQSGSGIDSTNWTKETITKSDNDISGCDYKHVYNLTVFLLYEQN